MQPEVSSLVFLQYLSTVFDNIEDGIIMISVESKGQYRLLVANKSFYNSTGYDPISTGQLIQDIVSPKTYTALVDYYDKVVSTKQPLEYMQPYEVPMGTITYRVKLIPILNSVGEVVQIAGAVQDVTELEMLRAKLRHTTRALQKLTKNLEEINAVTG